MGDGADPFHLKRRGVQGHAVHPAENVEDLMLHDEVIDAVAKGTFHIYPGKLQEFCKAYRY